MGRKEGADVRGGQEASAIKNQGASLNCMVLSDVISSIFILFSLLLVLLKFWLLSYFVLFSGVRGVPVAQRVEPVVTAAAALMMRKPVVKLPIKSATHQMFKLRSYVRVLVSTFPLLLCGFCVSFMTWVVF